MKNFDWYEFLLLALELRGRPGSQRAGQTTRLRTAIGRAYYAALNLARDFLHDVDGVDAPNLSTHEFIIQEFKASSDPRRRELAYELRFMRGLRTRADYVAMPIASLEKQTDKVLERTERVVRLLEKL